MTDLKLVPEGHCPACGQKLPETVRRACAVCGKPLLRHHKFYFEGSTVRHHDCAEPTAYPIARKVKP